MLAVDLSPINSLLFFGLLSCLAIFFFYKKKFFSFPSLSERFPISLPTLLIIFTIYLSFHFLIPMIVIQELPYYLSEPSELATMTYIHFFTLLLILVFVLFYVLFFTPSLLKKIWKNPISASSTIADLSMGIIPWLLIYPVVMGIGQLLELSTKTIFNLKELPLQNAILFLQNTLSHPTLLVLALTSIILFAPLVEELIFRGFLQNFLKFHLGRKSAILLTSLIFSLFHFSFTQGVANLVIIPPLFFLSWFLGFIYEKQGSLLSSIFLHMIFNAINSFNLILFKAMAL
jgi:hypothetical protein